MTTGGWIFMGLSVGFVWSLAGWCFYRVLFKGDEIEMPPESLGG